MFALCSDIDGNPMTTAGWKLCLVAVMAMVHCQASVWAGEQPEPATDQVAPATVSDDNVTSEPSENAAQPKPEDSFEKESPETELLFMVRTRADMMQTMVEQNLKDGMEETDCAYIHMKVREVPQSTHEQIEAVMRLADAKDSLEFGDEIKVRRLSTISTVWQFTVPAGDHEVLRELRVTYGRSTEDGASLEKTYEPQPIDKAIDPGSLAVVSALQGRYEFRPDDAVNMPPAKYVAVLMSSAAERAVTGEFPAGDRFFIISIVNFRGNQKQLFEALTDPDVLANPFTAISAQRRISLVFVDFESEHVGEIEGFDGLNYLVRRGGVPRREVARMWMLFPLTKEQCAEWCKRFDEMENPIVEIPELIRLNAVRANEKIPVFSLENAKWFELPPSEEPGHGRGFERSIPLVENTADFPALQQRYPEAHRLLVWEHGEEDKARAILVYGRFYRHEQIERWAEWLDGAVPSEHSADKSSDRD